jgi:hypothetical protein
MGASYVINKQILCEIWCSSGGKVSLLFFWVVTPYQLESKYQRFGRTYCLHLQGWSKDARGLDTACFSKTLVFNYVSAECHSREDINLQENSSQAAIWQRIQHCCCHGVVSHKVSHAVRPFVMKCASSSVLQSFLIHPPQLSGNYQHRHLVANQEKLGEKWPLNFTYKVSLFIIVGLFYMPKNDMGPTALLPHLRKSCYGFLSPLRNPSSAGFQPANLGSNGKH